MLSVSGYARHRGVATLAMLQPGIEPAILALLAANGASRPDQFGWVVGVGQAGMAIGASLCWRIDILAGRRAAQGAAAMAAIASLLLAMSHDFVSVLALRFALGTAMGLLMTRATALAACDRPHHAIGTMLLAQQALSTAAMAALPIVGETWGPTIALAGLGAGPLIILGLVGSDDMPAPLSASPTAPRDMLGVRPGARRAMALTFAVTMLAWSYMEVVGEALGLDADTIATTVAVGSLGSIPFALLASYRRPRVTPGFTLLLCGACLLAPMLLPAGAGVWAYLGAMVLFNGGSAFAMIRSAAWAMEGRADAADRRGVLTVQCMAMSVGPVVGALAISAGGLGGLRIAAVSGAVAAGLTLLPELRGRVMRIVREALRARTSKDQGIVPAGSFALSPDTPDAPIVPPARTAAISLAVNKAGFLPLAGGLSADTWLSKSAIS